VTVYEPAEPEHDSVDVPDPVTLVGESVHVKPLLDETLEERETAPANPLSGEIVTVEVPATPALKVTLVGLVDIVKSWTMNVMVAVWASVPLAPVTVTV